MSYRMVSVHIYFTNSALDDAALGFFIDVFLMLKLEYIRTLLLPSVLNVSPCRSMHTLIIFCKSETNALFYLLVVHNTHTHNINYTCGSLRQ